MGHPIPLHFCLFSSFHSPSLYLLTDYYEELSKTHFFGDIAECLPDWGHAETTVINCFSIFCPSILLSSGLLPQSLGADLNPWTMKRKKLYRFMPISNFTLWYPWFPPEGVTGVLPNLPLGAVLATTFLETWKNMKETWKFKPTQFHALHCANCPANVTLCITVQQSPLVYTVLLHWIGIGFLQYFNGIFLQ